MSAGIVVLISGIFVALVIAQRYVLHVTGVLADSEAEAATARGRALSPEERSAVRRAALPRLLAPLVAGLGFLLLAGAGSYALLGLLSLVHGSNRFGPLVWQFTIYFALILWWLLAAGVTLYAYGRLRPR
ncbi:MAG: hypothetical protein HXY25_10520 [Alphaproteobacteria bacterium]|nr:hypothetical protein [Alphaproteobacteria bacterium]